MGWRSFALGVCLLVLGGVLLLERTPDATLTKRNGTQVAAVTHVARTPTAVSVQPGASSALLIIPVQGIARRALTDTWGQARAQGRTHQGIDIMAASGTPVIAAADGRIVRFFDSVRGGITIYEFDRTQRFVYYYAHLLSRAPGLAEGQDVRQGQVIGYVGMTGNAPVPHLHFEIERLGPERRWWRAEAMNPYPFLLAGQAPQ